MELCEGFAAASVPLTGHNIYDDLQGPADDECVTGTHSGLRLSRTSRITNYYEDPKTAVERFDKASVKTLTRENPDQACRLSAVSVASYASAIAYTGIALFVNEVDDPSGNPSRSGLVAIVLLEHYYHTQVCSTCMMFRCYSDSGQYARDLFGQECVRQHQDGWIFSSTYSLFLTLGTFSLLYHVFAAAYHPETGQDRRKTLFYAFIRIFTISLTLFGAVLLGWGVTYCNFDADGVFQQNSRLLADSQVYEACKGKVALRLLPYRITEGHVYGSDFADYLLLFFELHWFFSLVNLFWWSRGCNRLWKRGQGYQTIPRWSLLLSHLSLRAVLPWVVATLTITAVNHFHQADLIIHTAFRMVFDQCVMNYFLFACLPPDINQFLCCSLTQAVRPRSIPWLKIFKAWAFSWDSYFDNPESPEPTESGDAPLTWRRRCMEEGVPRSFVTALETDTHAVFSLCDDGMLVVSFRGTGSLSNVSTDCSFGRRHMTILSREGEDGGGLRFGVEAARLDQGTRGIRAAASRSLIHGATIARDKIRNATFGLASHVGMLSQETWGCLVHGGFAKAYSSICHNLFLEHERLLEIHRPSSILITGHSLGGALATLFAMDLLSRQTYTPEQVWFITFGQPRVGNHSFAQCFDALTDRQQCFRLVYRGDVITGIPKFGCLFKHVAVEIEIDEDGNLLCDPTPLEKVAIRKSRHSHLAHGMGSYELGVRACVEGLGANADTMWAQVDKISTSRHTSVDEAGFDVVTPRSDLDPYMEETIYFDSNPSQLLSPSQ